MTTFAAYVALLYIINRGVIEKGENILDVKRFVTHTITEKLPANALTTIRDIHLSESAAIFIDSVQQ